jgi:hypothetical protein
MQGHLARVLCSDVSELERVLSAHHDSAEDAGAVEAAREGVPPVLRIQVFRLHRTRVRGGADAGVGESRRVLACAMCAAARPGWPEEIPCVSNRPC